MNINVMEHAMNKKIVGDRFGDRQRVGAVTHGKTDTATYNIWQHMLARCYRRNCLDYPAYGGRGIRVCRRWRGSFSAFLGDMGERPGRRFCIDRINNDGHYSPQNCRWADPVTSSRNRSNNLYVVYQGQRILLMDLADRVGMKRTTLRRRIIAAGLSPEEAAHRPVAPWRGGKH